MKNGPAKLHSVINCTFFCFSEQELVAKLTSDSDFHTKKAEDASIEWA